MHVITDNLHSSSYIKLIDKDSMQLAPQTINRIKNGKEIRPATIAVVADEYNIPIESLIDFGTVVNATLTPDIDKMEYCRVSTLAKWLNRSKRTIRNYITGIENAKNRYGSYAVIHVGNRYEASPMAVLDYMIYQYAIMYGDSHIMLPYDPERLSARLKGGIEHER